MRLGYLIAAISAIGAIILLLLRKRFVKGWRERSLVRGEGNAASQQPPARLKNSPPAVVPESTEAPADLKLKEQDDAHQVPAAMTPAEDSNRTGTLQEISTGRVENKEDSTPHDCTPEVVSKSVSSASGAMEQIQVVPEKPAPDSVETDSPKTPPIIFGPAATEDLAISLVSDVTVIETPSPDAQEKSQQGHIENFCESNSDPITAGVRDEIEIVVAPQLFMLPLPAEITEAPAPVENFVDEPAGIPDTSGAVLDILDKANSSADNELRAPRKYQIRMPTPALKPPAKAVAKRQKRIASQFPVTIRLLFEHGGFCSISLLPGRDDSLPTAITAIGHKGKQDFSPFTENWFQDLMPAGIGSMLVEGLEWIAKFEGRSVRWSLPGRKLFVLAPNNNLSGFIAVQRLQIGGTHAILCHSSILESVLAVLAEAGAIPGSVLREDMGAPSEWVVLCDVVAQKVVAPTDGNDILNAIRPAHDAELSLEGGIRIGPSAYLAGHAPNIIMRGDPLNTVAVLIDGVVATRSENGCFTAPGWDLPGQHTIWSGSNRTYSIVKSSIGGESWSAYSFRHGANGSRLGITGALVHVSGSTNGIGCQLVPASNRMLIGAIPGQVHLSGSGSGGHLGHAIAFADFVPVWALPADPLSTDKRTAKILLLGKPLPPDCARLETRVSRVALRTWSDMILRASQKHLAISPDSPELSELWRAYVLIAKSIRKGRR